MRAPLFLAALLAGCATSGAAVEVKGNDVDVSLMAGKWHGTYEALPSGRKGAIDFDLFTGYHVAEGKVMMNSLGDPAHSKPLAIRFVQVSGARMSGKIEPYTDPACQCQVEAEFLGTISGKTIGGTFSTRAPGGATLQNGRWSVSRVE